MGLGSGNTPMLNTCLKTGRWARNTVLITSSSDCTYNFHTKPNTRSDLTAQESGYSLNFCNCADLGMSECLSFFFSLSQVNGRPHLSPLPVPAIFLWPRLLFITLRPFFNTACSLMKKICILKSNPALKSLYNLM